MKVLSIFGTRPEAIKMAPVVKALEAGGATSLVCVTAQHRQMLDQVMDFFDLSADRDLDLMQPGQSLSGLFSRVITGVDQVLEELKPDLALVHGDTSTAAASALACFHRRIPVGHVEAGLRSGNFSAPFPEEMNRVVIDGFADYLLAPTWLAQTALLREGKDTARIWVTGNTVIDALLWAVKRLETDADLRAKIAASLPKIDPNKKMILVTGHRRENFGGGFDRLCSALSGLAARDDVQIIYPVHLNPNVQKPVYETLGKFSNVHLIEPVDYPSFVYLMQQSYLIITDSGGVQEEAPTLGRPVLVTRDVTERQEAVEAGAVKLVGTDTDKIMSEANLLLDNLSAYEAMSKVANPYGDGKAAARIVSAIGVPGALTLDAFKA